MIPQNSALMHLMFALFETGCSLQKNRWPGSQLLCSIVLKNMLSDFLTFIMWPKWEHKHLQEAEKSVFNWEESYTGFMIVLTYSILHWF